MKTKKVEFCNGCKFTISKAMKMKLRWKWVDGLQAVQVADPDGHVDSILMDQATLCLDCNTITASHGNCLCCGSAAMLNLARVMNREEKESKQ